MKINKTSRLLLCLVALTTWMLGACDDTMKSTTMLGFPTDTLSYVVNPNDTVAIPVNVSANWKLLSNKDWCRTEGAMTTPLMSGKDTVLFIVSDKGQGFGDDKAEITLRMNDESRVIAIITRLGKSYFMEISDNNGVYAAGQSILLGTSGSAKLNVRTNISSILQSSPQWLKVTRDGESMALEVVKDSVKYTINNPNDSLILFNSDTTFRRSFHVHYMGMDSMDLRVKPSIDSLIVSRNAKRCKVGETNYSTPISFAVETLNDQYKLVSVSYESDGCRLLPKKEQWFEVEDDRRGNIRLSFEEENLEDNRRMASLLALPQGIIDSLSNCSEGYDAAVTNFLLDKESNGSDLREEVRKFRLVKMVQLGKMEITISPETRWDLRVSTDGTTYSDAMSGADFDAVDNPVEATITTEFGYKLLCASYDSQVGCTLMEVNDSWLDVTDDQKSRVKVRFKANEGNERILYLFALPLPLIEEIEAESMDLYEALATRLFEEVDGLLEIKAATEQFVIARFVQQANEENSIKVLKRGVESMEVTKETNQEWLAIAAERGVEANKVFRCSLSLDYKYLINPLLPLSVWDTSIEDNKDRIEIYGKSGVPYEIGKMTAEDKPFSGEYTMMEEMEGDYMLVQLRANEYEVDPENFEYEFYIKEDFIIYFIDNDTEYLKALVVEIK